MTTRLTTDDTGRRAAAGDWRLILAAIGAIVRKDLQIERRTRQTISVMLMFSLVVVVMFNFALEADLGAARAVATGLLWATIILAGTLGLNRALALESENQSIEAAVDGADQSQRHLPGQSVQRHNLHAAAGSGAGLSLYRPFR